MVMKSIHDPIMEYNKADGVLSDVWWVTPLLNLKTRNSQYTVPPDILRHDTYKVWFLSTANETSPLTELIERKCPGTWRYTMVYVCKFLRIVNEFDPALVEMSDTISDNLKAAKWVAQTLKTSTFASDKARADLAIDCLLDSALRTLDKMHRHKPKARMLSRLNKEIAGSVTQGTVDTTVDAIERFRESPASGLKELRLVVLRWTGRLKCPNSNLQTKYIKNHRLI